MTRKQAFGYPGPTPPASSSSSSSSSSCSRISRLPSQLSLLFRLREIANLQPEEVIGECSSGLFGEFARSCSQFWVRSSPVMRRKNDSLGVVSAVLLGMPKSFFAGARRREEREFLMTSLSNHYRCVLTAPPDMDRNKRKIGEVALQSEQISDELSPLKYYPMIRMKEKASHSVRGQKLQSGQIQMLRKSIA
ncbi:hypothetical protein NL676_031437 [Syzygium grande]|nr:hypothetical protein NL676_031437 [Syzygium grande]